MLPQFVPASCGVVSDAGGDSGGEDADAGVEDVSANNGGGSDSGDNNGASDGGQNNGAVDAEQDTPVDGDGGDDAEDGDGGGVDVGPCGEQGRNACGGCEALAGQPGEHCGDCPAGRWACDGADAVLCEGGEGNACGGCVELTASPGERCGECGEGTWTCEGTLLACVGTGLNSCGGCSTLAHGLGESCGVCAQGQWVCDGAESLRCTVPDGTNRCGGCAALSAQPGESCGACGTGVIVCESVDEVRCEGGEANACGGCGALAGEPGTSCACDAGQWTCGGDGVVSCPDQTATSSAPIDLGNMRPNDDTRTTTGVLHDASDEDWYVLRAEESIAVLRPDVELQAPVDFGLCLYYVWDDHTDTPTCRRGEPGVFGNLRGCCTDSTSGTDRVEMDVDVTFRDDRGHLYMRVFSGRGASSCEAFTLRYAL